MAPATPPLLEADRLTVTFDRGLRALSDVSLAIRRGETLALVGESGSGKSTLGKTLLALHIPTAGSVHFDGRDIFTLTRGERLAFRRRAQMLFQDPLASLSPRFTVRALLAEPIRIHGLPFASTWRHIENLLPRLGLSRELLAKHPHQLSGGQARRVALVRVLALHPELLIADEPTAGLDVSVQGGLLNLLRELQSEFHLTYLLITHNLNVARRVTNRVAVMYLGQIVELAPTAQLFTQPAHPYSAALLSANPTLDPARRRHNIVLAGEIPSPRAPPPGCRFHTRGPQAQPRCRAEAPRLSHTGEDWQARCHFPLAGERP
ncbi:MAG: ABC transporter ATP-binding protein [Gammaproteobacteria bacterium]